MLSITTNLDVENGGHSCRRPCVPPLCQGFVLSFVSTTLCGVGMFAILKGLMVFFSGWTNLVETGMDGGMTTDITVMDNEQDIDNMNTKRENRAKWFVLYGLVIAVELLFLMMLFKLFTNWAFSKSLVALDMNVDDQFAGVLYSSIFLVAGIFLYVVLQGCLMAQEIFMEETSGVTIFDETEDGWESEYSTELDMETDDELDLSQSLDDSFDYTEDEYDYYIEDLPYEEEDAELSL